MHIVLAGHRAAGKTSLLPVVAALTGLPGIDLDQEIARIHQRPIRELFTASENEFRAAEKIAFTNVTEPHVVSVGGGFLSHHGLLLNNCVTVLVPITFETFVERMQADTTRPRLRPELSLEEELKTVFEERERKHREVRTVSLVDFLLKARRGFRPRRIVTLPSKTDVATFVNSAVKCGADMIEVRTDLTGPEIDLVLAGRALPLLIAERKLSIPDQWKSIASLTDVETPDTAGTMISHHAHSEMSTHAAVAHWRMLPPGKHLKHVEPVTSVADALRLLETQQQLINAHGPHRVTVLATGGYALPIRALLSDRNAFEYAALSEEARSAEGQRLLRDVVREHRHAPIESARLGILGAVTRFSNSPRLHDQPFDRIELPPKADFKAFITALRPWYRGFAVTAPFKEIAARAIDSALPAINTLVRTPEGWRGVNTDISGAQLALTLINVRHVTVLGTGGVRSSLQTAADAQSISLQFVKREHCARVFTGTLMWTWPASVEAPVGMRFENARVGIIAYGIPGRIIRQRIEALGGTPVLLGLKWFLTQAREQRLLWRSAS